MLRFQDLVDGFKKLNLKRGDVLLVHSSFKSFGGVEGGPQTVIDALLSILGEEGTLIVPTFNFDFCEGKAFDMMNTPSKQGIITEFVRKNPKSRRILHPIHSFSILGKLADQLGSLRYKSSFGKDSLFAKLRELDSKIMIVGLIYSRSLTFIHHVEEMVGCDYRYLKKFTGTIIDEFGKIYADDFLMNVRDLDRGVITNCEPMGEILDREGIAKIAKIGSSTIRLMKANDVYKCVLREMKRNPHILCEIHPPE
jgi:aminoglycoside 3-N-acetyltransferase